MAKSRAVEIILNDAKKRELTALTRKHGASQALADRARIVLAAAGGLVPGAVVSEVARRHGLSPRQLFTWRRQARHSAAGRGSAAPEFVPAVVETVLPAGLALGSRRKRIPPVARFPGVIEVEIAGMAVRIGHGADEKTVVARP